MFEVPTIAELTVKITLLSGAHVQGGTEDKDYDQMATLLDELDNLSDDVTAQYLADGTW